MNKQLDRRLHRLDWLLGLISFSVLLVCLFYTLAFVFQTPYSGININSAWIVTSVDPCHTYLGWCEANRDGLQALQVGDQLLAIGDLTYEDYWGDRQRAPPFDGHGPGESVPITLSQDGQRQTIHWQMPVVTGANRVRRLIGLLAYLPFWLAGTAVLLFLQPRDGRWRLLVSFNYLTAIWLAVGIVSGLQVAVSSLVFHAVTWLMVPVYLHLHLTVPAPLIRGRFRYFLPPLYAIAAILATLELIQLLPVSAYSLGLLLAILGSLGLLAFRLFDRSSPSVRPATRLMLAGVGLAFGPGIALWLFPKLLGPSAPGGIAINVAILAIPVLPLFYTYALYKRRLGPLEFRANRLLSLYSFILLYATAFVLVFSIGSQWLSSPDSLVIFSLAVSIVFVIAALPLLPRFQRLVGRLAYGTEHDPDEIIRFFASRIPAGLSLEALGRLLADEVAPSLLIRQSALLLLADDSLRPDSVQATSSPCDGDTNIVYARGVNLGEMLKTPLQVEQLLSGAGQYRPSLAEAQDEHPDGHGFDWVRLVIPLEIRENTIGVWLFGRRDPDDYYPQDDIMLLTTLASQVAVAVENAQLAAEALRESEEKYRNVVERANDGITIIQDTIVKYANARLAEMWGGTVDEVVDTPFTDYVHPDELPKVVSRYKQRMTGEDVTPVYETVLRRKDGGRVYVELNVGVIAYQGNPAELVIVRDITQRKQAEKALRESEKRYRAVVEDQTELICRFLPNGTLTFVNDAYCRYFGRERKELIGSSFMPLIPEEDRETVKKQLASLSLDNPAAIYEHRVILPDGQIRWQQWTDRAIFDEQGRLAEYQSVGRDITERKRAEEALRKAHDELEMRVQERTAELAQANEALQAEIIERKRAEEAMRRERDLAEALEEAAAVVSSTLDPNQVLDHILEQVSRVVHNDATNIMLIESDQARIVRWQGYKHFHVEEFVSPVVFHVPETPGLQQMRKSGQPLVISDTATYPGWVYMQEMEWLRSYAAAPIFVRGEVIGFLNVDSATPGFFDQVHAEALRAFADHAATAIENAQLYEAAQREISERQQAEKQLIRLSSAVKSSVDSIVIMDVEGKIIDVNEAALKMYDTDNQEDLIGQNVLAFIAPEQRENGLAGIEFVLEKGYDQSRDYEVITRDGSRIPVELSATVMKDADGKPIGIVLVARDITNRKKAEETLLAYQERLRSLASQLSLAEEQERRRITTVLHDRIGQTLALSKIKLEALRESASSTEFGESLDEVQGFIGRVIQDTRSLTSEIGSPILYELGLEAAVEWLTEQTQDQYGIPCHFEDDRQPKPLGDDIRVLLFRAVRELLVNIAKHAQAHNVRVSLRRAGSELQIIVEDDGVGFDTSDIDSYYARPQGFGLFSIRERLDHLGGQLHIKSKRGHGTRITLVAPLAGTVVTKEELT